MVGVPRYISQQDFQPIQSVSAAPALKAIGETFDKLGQSLGIQAGVQEGAKAGEDPSFQPVPDLTPAATAFNESALQTNKLIANNQAAEHLAQLKQNADRQFADPQKAALFYNNNANTYLKGFLAEVPIQNKPYLEASLNHQRLLVNADYNKRIQKQRMANSYVSYVNNQQSNFDGMTGALQEGDLGLPLKNTTGASQQYYQQIIQSGKLALENGLITKPEFGALTKRAQLSYQTGSFMHGAENALKAGTLGKYLSDANVKGIPGLSTTQTNTLINRAKLMGLQELQGAGVDAQVVTKNAKQNLKNALQTGSFSESESKQFCLLHPSQCEQHTKQLQTNQLIHSDSVRVASQNLFVQNQMISGLKSKYGSSDFQALNNTIKVKNAEIDNRPFEFYKNNPAVMDAVFQSKGLAVALKQTGVNLSVQQLQNSTPSEKIIILQELRGTNRNKVWATTRADAQNSATLVQNGTLLQVQAKFAQERKRLGSNFPLYINNIKRVSKEDGTPVDGSLIMASSLNPSDPNSAGIFNSLRTSLSTMENRSNVTGLQLFTLNNKISALFQEAPNVSGESGHGLMGDYLQMVRHSSATIGTRKHLSDVQKYLKHTSLYYISLGQPPETALSNAETLFTSRLNFVNQNNFIPLGGIGTILGANPARSLATTIRQSVGIHNPINANGPLIAIPKELNGIPVNPLLVINYLRKMQPQIKNFDFAVPPSIKPNLTAAARRTYYFNNYLKGGHWINNPEFTGFLWVDSAGRLAVSPTGQNHEISVSDAVNNSKLLISPAELEKKLLERQAFEALKIG